MSKDFNNKTVVAAVRIRNRRSLLAERVMFQKDGVPKWLLYLDCGHITRRSQEAIPHRAICETCISDARFHRKTKRDWNIDSISDKPGVHWYPQRKHTFSCRYSRRKKREALS